MTTRDLQELVAKTGKSVRKIEIELGIGEGILAKALKGKRDLPEKWEMPLKILANPSEKNPEGEKKIGQEVRLVVKQDALTAYGKLKYIDTPSGKRVMLDESIFDGEKVDKYLLDEFGQTGKTPPLPPGIEFRPNDNELKFGRPRQLGDDENIPWPEAKKWIKEIEDFCAANNCTPQQLMDNYKSDIELTHLRVVRPSTDWLSDLLD